MLELDHQALVLMLALCQINVHVFNHIDFSTIASVLLLQAINDSLKLFFFSDKLFLFSLDIIEVLGQLFQILHEVYLLNVLLLDSLNNDLFTF